MDVSEEVRKVRLLDGREVIEFETTYFGWNEQELSYRYYDLYRELSVERNKHDYWHRAKLQAEFRDGAWRDVTWNDVPEVREPQPEIPPKQKSTLEEIKSFFERISRQAKNRLYPNDD